MPAAPAAQPAGPAAAPMPAAPAGGSSPVPAAPAPGKLLGNQKYCHKPWDGPFKTFKDVRAKYFCASLMRTQIHTSRRHASSGRRVIKRTMIGPGFNNLGRSVIPIFLLIDLFF